MFFLSHFVSAIFNFLIPIWNSYLLLQILDVHFETLLYILKVCPTVMCSLTFDTSQTITMILNNLQLVYMSQFSLKN